jgi:hypothetical protein
MPQWQLKHRDGELYPSEVISMEMSDARSLGQLGWERNLDWKKYFQPDEQSTAYKLLVIENSFIQGAIAYRDREDYVYVDLLESSPTNRHNNKDREFKNVSDILLGAACLHSLDIGKDGYVMFTPKTYLFEYYAYRFNAKRIGTRMYLDTLDAKHLIGLYYK